jgi:hypothetical protein
MRSDEGVEGGGRERRRDDERSKDGKREFLA